MLKPYSVDKLERIANLHNEWFIENGRNDNHHRRNLNQIGEIKSLTKLQPLPKLRPPPTLTTTVDVPCSYPVHSSKLPTQSFDEITATIGIANHNHRRYHNRRSKLIPRQQPSLQQSEEDEE